MFKIPYQVAKIKINWFLFFNLATYLPNEQKNTKKFPESDMIC